MDCIKLGQNYGKFTVNTKCIVIQATYSAANMMVINDGNKIPIG